MRALTLLFAPVLVVATGCGPKPINENKTFTLDTQVSAAGMVIPAQKKATKLTVEFTSSTGDVAVYLFKQSDVPTDEAMGEVPSDKKLGSKRGKSETFTVDVPENTAVRLVVREHTAAKTEVAVKVSAAP